jgi:hypothetical protein
MKTLNRLPKEPDRRVFFVSLICQHLRDGGIDPQGIRFQTDNGSEFIGCTRQNGTRDGFGATVQEVKANPHPDKTIKQVVIDDMGMEPKQQRFLALLGVTAAILPPESTSPAAAHDPKKSRALFIEASALIDKKETKEAAAKLQAAIDADDQNTAAWTALTDIRAKTDNIDSFTKLCEK